jgi:hypothetical protein
MFRARRAPAWLCKAGVLGVRSVSRNQVFIRKIRVP